MVVANKGLKDMSNVKNYGQSRVMYGAAAIRFFDDDVALFVLLHAGSAMRRDLLKPEPSIWLREASGVRLDLVRCKLCPGVTASDQRPWRRSPVLLGGRL